MGRLARTSTFLAVTTFGTAEHAQQAIDVVRSVHVRVRGTASDGRPTRPTTRGCCAGSTSPRRTASLPPTSATANARSTDRAATSTSRRPRRSPTGSGPWTRRVRAPS
ncbi:oxygenase MpaB family protein [Oerskovia sp. M15]